MPNIIETPQNLLVSVVAVGQYDVIKLVCTIAYIDSCGVFAEFIQNTRSWLVRGACLGC